MMRGSLDLPGAAFSLESCFIDPLSERFLPDIAWTLDGKYLCALTTHGQIFVLTGAAQLHSVRACLGCNAHVDPNNSVGVHTRWLPHRPS